MSKEQNHSHEDSTTDDPSNTNRVSLDLDEKLFKLNIVDSFTFSYSDFSSCNQQQYWLMLKLNHRYDKMTIPHQLDFKNYSKSVQSFENKLKSKGVGIDQEEQVGLLVTTVENNIEKMLEFIKNCDTAKEEEGRTTGGIPAQKILSLIKEKCHELFIDQYGEPYAAVKIKDHIETLPLNHQRFRSWTCRQCYEQEDGSIPNSENITNALNVLKANAEFDGRLIELHLRVAYGDDIIDGERPIYYDLTNPGWEAVKITSKGWTVEKTPVLFKRRNAQPQTYPSREYPPDIFDQFMKLLNITGEGVKLLVKCHIIASFFPEIDHPILMLHGDPGSAKSSIHELIKTLVDPSSVLTFALPRDVNEIVQQLDHNHVAFYDNVSKIPYWISDQFCRASTGAGSSKRRLYTDDDDKIYNFRRCVGFNGINLGATKSDLLDRGLIIRIERIDDKVKRKKRDIWRDFERIRSQLLGYNFDIVAKVLQMRLTTSIEFERLPRMAEFAEIGEIISRCMGNPDNRFIEAYYENIKLQTEQVLDSSLVASAIIKFMDQSEERQWKGTATELLEQLDSIVGEKIVKNRYWPKTPSLLSRRINEIKSNLREIGIIIEEGQSDPVTRARSIVITKVELSDRPTKLGKMPLEPLESFGDQNCAPVDSDNLSGNSNVAQMAPDKNPQNRAQNTGPSAMSGMSGIFRNTMEYMSEKGTSNNDDVVDDRATSNHEPVLTDSSNDSEQALPPYVHRIHPHSDIYRCDHCRLRGDRWSWANHVHAEEQANSKKSK